MAIHKLVSDNNSIGMASASLGLVGAYVRASEISRGVADGKHLRQCSSLWRGGSAVAAKAIGRAYAKLGYQLVKERPAESDKHVIVLERAGERFVSDYDSTNADLDSGELEDAALEASRLLKSGAVFTS